MLGKLLDIDRKDLSWISAYDFKECFYLNNEQMGKKLNAIIVNNKKHYDKYLKEGQYSIESGYSMMSEFIQSEDMPTAVFAASDYIAFGAMKAIKENGLRIPEDISVIGFDDAQICNYTTPTLTTIHAPAYDMGQYGANFLFGATNCSITTPLNVKMPCELVERESCGPVKNKESR